MRPGHNLKPLPWELWGSVLLRNIISIRKSTTLNKMAIWKFLLDVFREMVGVEGVLVAFQSLLTLKKGTRTVDFQSNEPPFEVYTTTPSILSAPGKKIINCTLCQHWSYMPSGHNLKLLLRGLWGVSSSKRYFLSGNQLRWTKWLSQNFEWMCLGEWWAWGGANCPPITFNY